MQRTIRLLPLVISAALLASSVTAFAQAPSPDRSTPKPDRVESWLRQVAKGGVKITRAGTFKIGPSALFPADAQGRLLTYIALDANTFSPDLRTAMEKLGVKIDLVSERWQTVQAWIPTDKLDDVANLPGVKRVGAPDVPVTEVVSNRNPQTGSVTSAGDAILKADQVRAQKGVDGSGIPVGVISDSASPSRVTQSTTTNDLPSVLAVLKAGTGHDEGVAMMEIVHDLAPGSPEGFYGPDTSLDAGVGVQRLANEVGARVIVDDLSFFGEPWFEEGPLAQTTKDVINTKDVVYLSAAGNYRKAHFFGQFSGATGAGNICGDATAPSHSLQQFASGVTRLTFHHFGGTLGVNLQWANPFNAPTDNYDLYVCDGAGTQLLGSSKNVQGPGQNFQAREFLGGGVPADDYSIVIDKVSGNDVPVEIYITPNSAEIAGGLNKGGGVVGQRVLNEALITAAIDASQSGANQTEDFSNIGPAHIFFPTREDRLKPDVSGIDGTQTSVPGFQPFFGTSAAAPHIAGVAALLRSGFPNANNARIRQSIQLSSVDIEAPGYDFQSGYGRVDALAAYNLIPTALSVAQFSARFASNSVALNWTTGSEAGVFGFNVLRSGDSNLAHATRVNSQLILASGNGSSYQFADTSVSASTSYSYWLQVVKTDGSVETVGPVSVTRPAVYRLYAPTVSH